MAGLLALLVASLGLGVLAQRTRAFPDRTAEALNAFILNIALPALVLRVMHAVPLTASLLWGPAMVWVQFLGAWALFTLLGRVFQMPRATVGALVLTAGLGNTAFIGLPVIEVTLGRDALGTAVFVDQIGSFLCMSSLGILVAAAASGRSAEPSALVRKVVLFPPFIALVAALLLRPVPFPDWLELTLTRLGDLLTPLALFSVGFQLRLRRLGDRLGALGAGLGWKLVGAPLVAGLLLLPFVPRDGTLWAVTVIQCAMPPMVTGGILAAQHELDPPLAAAMVGLGLPVSALTGTLLIAFIL